MNESAVQRKIIERHQKKGWLVVKLLQTTLNGIPDLLLLRNGVTVFIECKRPGVKTAEPLQVYRHRQLRDLGFDVYLTDDPNFLVPEIRKPVRVVGNPVVHEPIDMDFVQEHIIVEMGNLKKKMNAKPRQTTKSKKDHSKAARRKDI